MSTSTRPVPLPDEYSAPYWSAAAEHRLVLARCASCHELSLPPAPLCPNCHSTAPSWTWVDAEGSGRIRSWTTMRSSFLPGFGEEVPFVLVDVELDAQRDLRLIGRLLDGPTAVLRIDARVILGFEDIGTGVAVPAFSLAGTS